MKNINFVKTNSSLPGILFVITGGFVFSIQDVIIKLISGSYPVHEIVFFRSLFAVLPILAIVKMEGGIHLLKTTNMLFQLTRGLLLLLCYTSYYLSMALIPLSHAVTIFFCCPLFIALLSIPLLGERVDQRGWASLIVGFVGIVVVVRPGGGGEMLNAGTMLAVFAGLFYALSAVCTRKYGERESGASLVFYPMMVFLILSGAIWMAIGDGRFVSDDNRNMDFLLRNWAMPGAKDILLMFVIGFIATAGIYCLSQGYRLGQASVVAPFEYFVIPVSIVWGYVFWQELPDRFQVMGIIMIVGSGGYVLQRK